MDKNSIAYCGLYCGACSFKQAFLQKDREHLNHMPGYYDGYKNIPLEEDCPGCRMENICGDCPIRDCARAKDIEWCSQCEDFPCNILKNFAHDGKPHHEETLENLALLSDMGENEWLKHMSEKWACSICGKTGSWYYKPCDCSVKNF